MKIIYALVILLFLSASVRSQVVINEVYGGGGNSGATYKNDFIELYNNGSSAVSLAGWSVQYGSATGTTWQVTNLSGSIAAHGYYLIQEAVGAGGTTDLPTPDATGTIAMSATAAKVALANSTTALSGSCPTGGSIIDFVGYGTTANCYEGTGPTTAPSNTTSVQRIFNSGTSTAQDTQNNSADFTSGSPTPTNSGSGGGDIIPPTVVSFSPADDATNVATNSTLSITFSEPIKKNVGVLSLNNSTTGTTDYVYFQTSNPNVTISGSTLNISGINLQPNNSYYITVADSVIADLPGNKYAGISTNTTWNFSTATVASPAIAGVLNSTYNLDNSQNVFGSDGFKQYSVTGPLVWESTTFGRTVNGVQMNGFFNNTDQLNEDWFISPKFDLTGTNFPLLSFYSRTKFNGDPLQLKVSTNYPGYGNPNSYTWTTLNGKFPAQTSDTWTLSDNIDLSAFKTTNTYFAFAYTSTVDDGARWTLDDIRIDNSSSAPPATLSVTPTDIQFGYVAAGGNAVKTIQVTGSNITGDIIITASSNFSLSSDGTTYSSSITLLQAGANNVTKTIYVRYSPTQINRDYPGTVSVSTPGVSTITVNLKGSTIDPAITLEVVNWNLEWFGSTQAGFGPPDKNLQEQNVKTVLQNVGADIYGLVEVVDTARLGNIVRQMPGYTYVVGNFGSHVNPPDPSGDPSSVAQKEAFVYKTSMFSNVTARPLINNQDINSTSYYNWASGRYPYLMKADVTLNGITKTIDFVLIHAKANTSPTTTSYNRRKAAATELHDTLNAFFSTDNIIVLGDFNDDLDSTITDGITPKISSYSAFTGDNTNFYSPTLALSLAGKASTVKYSDVIDHVVVSNEMQQYYMYNSASILTDVAATISSYGTTTTDHYPVFTRYSFIPLEFFRTITNGTWNNTSTWESSSDNSVWHAATTTPDYNSNAITIRNNVNVTANITIDETTINSGDTLSVNPGVVLTVNNGTGTDITVNSGGSLALKSTASGTASIGNSAGSISGNVTVERYTSDKRSWRLLAVPFSSSGQTIKGAWQEGAASSGSNPNPPYGTHITTFSGDPNASNFDAIKPGSSIRIYSGDNFNSDASHTPNTTTNIVTNPACFLFVRGDRTIDLNNSSSHGAATLRITGTPSSGNVTKGVTGTSFSLIPNPYPSAVDFDAIKAVAANSSITTFYVWDATLGTVGQYRTISITGAGPAFTYTATPGSSNSNWRYVESGTAFMVPGNRTVDFTEATKSSGNPPSSMLRTVSNESSLVLNLHSLNGNSASLADGVRLVFDNRYSTAVDNDDAKKLEGFDVNLGIVNNNNILSVDRRPINLNDIIPLKLWNSVTSNYQFEFVPENLTLTGFAYLKDNYLGTFSPISLSAGTIISFSITADAASAASNRFSIVFSNSEIVPKPLIVIYPNPVQNGLIKLQFNNMPKGNYSVRLLNTIGQNILSKQITHSDGTAIENISVNKITGVYLVEITKPDKSKQVEKVIIL